MFRLVVLHLLVLFLALPTSTVAMNWFDEYIPRKELLEPVIIFDVNLLDQSPQAKVFEFKYPGRYRVDLSIRHTKANMPPRTDLSDRVFSLRGSLDIRNSQGVIFNSSFNKEVKSNNTGVKLMVFELDDKYLSGEKVFSVSFYEIGQDISQYFESVQIYVRKELKHSIFD